MDTSSSNSLRFGNCEVQTDASGHPIELGRGGMGTTYKAMHLGFKRPVVVKVINEELLQNNREGARKRFFNEAHAAVLIQHPNVARVLDCSPEDSEQCYIAMEFIEGETLKSHVARHGALSVGEALMLLRGVADALSVLEEHNLVHRDIKPENIMLERTRTGVRARLIDFGVVKSLVDGNDFHMGITGGKAPLTPYYASPEQIEPSEDVPLDIRSDMYSLGATMWHSLTGFPPFLGTLMVVMYAQVWNDPDWSKMNGAGDDVQNLLRLMLAKKPDQRPENAAALLEVWDRTIEAVKAADMGDTRLSGARAAASIPAIQPAADSSESQEKGAPQPEPEAAEEPASHASAVPPEAAEVSSDLADEETETVPQPQSPAAPNRRKFAWSGWLAAAFVVVVTVVGFFAMNNKKPGNPWETGAVGKTIAGKLPGGAEITFCYCPPGTFTMGSPITEAARGADEGPVEVGISKGFWMAQTEITQEQYESLMPYNESRFRGKSLPAENVSWHNAQLFIERLNQSGLNKVGLPPGWKFSLPTEAQWEYACRAGTKTVFSFGNELNGTQANCVGTEPYGTTVKGPYPSTAVEVKKYAPNAWGLYDMHGNLWEWTMDYYQEKLEGGEDPKGPTTGTHRVSRGGCWRNDASNCRSASRTKDISTRNNGRQGFRVAAIPADL